MEKERVLLLNGEAVQTLIIARSLKKAGYEVHLLCNATLNYGYHTKYATKRAVAPSGEKEYLECVKRYVVDNRISTIIPMNDEGATFLAKNKSELIQLVPFLMPDWDVFEKGYDKNLLMTLCAEKGYPNPVTIDLEKTDYRTIHEFDFPFPAIIKPNYTTGGRGMTLVESTKELREHYPAIHEQYGACHLQQFIEAGGRQIKVQVFIDPRDGKSYTSVIHKQRFYPEKGGSSSCNVTIRDDKTADMCVSILKDIGWEGFADFDLIEDPHDGILKVMEINPRIPACIKSAVLSGMDYGTMIADVSLGKPLKEYHYKPGQKLRHIGFEFLWFKYSKNRFKTKPNWFHWIDPKLSFQDFSWRDPFPFFYGTIGNIAKQMNPEFRKSKSGLRDESTNKHIDVSQKEVKQTLEIMKQSKDEGLQMTDNQFNNKEMGGGKTSE